MGVRSGKIGTVQDVMERYGENDDQDKECMKYEYSLWSGCCLCSGSYESEDPKVEIEDTCKEDRVIEGAVQDKHRALQRLKEFMPMLAGSAALWFFILLAFILNLATVECDESSSLGEGLIPIFLLLPGMVWLVFAISRLLTLQSKTSFEGVPLVRLIINGSCFESPRLQTILSVSDLYGKMTRAMFIGRVVSCCNKPFRGSASLNSRFDGWAASEKPDISSAGDLHIVALCFFLIPLLLQMLRMLRSVCQIRWKIVDLEQKGEDCSLGIQGCIDDYGAVADWALLKPCALIFFYAAVPLSLEDKNDAARVWDLFRTRAIVTAANLIPDSIVQLWLMTIYFSITADGIDFYPKLQLSLSMTITSLLSIHAGYGMIQENFTMTVVLGTLICVAGFLPLVWIFGTFACAGDEFFSLGFQCISAK